MDNIDIRTEHCWVVVCIKRGNARANNKVEHPLSHYSTSSVSGIKSSLQSTLKIP